MEFEHVAGYMDVPGLVRACGDVLRLPCHVVVAALVFAHRYLAQRGARHAPLDGQVRACLWLRPTPVPCSHGGGGVVWWLSAAALGLDVS